MNRGGLAPEVARARQFAQHGLERERLQQQSELVQQKARQQRHRLEQESIKLRTDIRDNKFVARERAFENGQATRVEREHIRSKLLTPQQLILTSLNKSQRAPTYPGASGRASPRNARPSTMRCGGARRPSVATRSRPVWKTRPVRPASRNMSANWPRLAEAGGRPALDLAGCAEGRIGRSLWAAVFHAA
jgi:hypothetical protein